MAVFPLHTWSQTDTMMVGVGTGWNANTVLDEYLSPMHYRGNGFMFQVCLHEQNDRFYDQLAFIYQKSKISPDTDNNSASHLYRGNIDWIRAYRLKTKPEKWSIFMGFHFLTSYNGTKHTIWKNNNYSHSLVFNLGPSLVINYAPWEKDIHFTWELAVPILNYIIRPSQGSILPDGSIKRSRQDVRGFATGGRITSLHEYQRIYSNLFLSYRISTRFDARTGYQWDFQNYTVNNPYQSANHLLYVAIYYRFKK